MQGIIALIEKEIQAIIAIGGYALVVLNFMFKVIYAQNMNEIEKVFMDRKQRINLKLIELSVVVIVMGLVNITLRLIRDDMLDGLLAEGCRAAGILILICFIYRLVYFYKSKKTDKKWKYHIYMEKMLFVSMYLIGTGMGVLIYNDTQVLWERILICLIAALATSFFMVILAGFFGDGPSKVYFYGKGGGRIYIFSKLEDEILLCGDNKDIRKAKIILIPFDNFQKSHHELLIEELNNQNH